MQAAAASPLLSLSPSSPSFNSYSSANLADIAARVVEEFRQESDDLDSNIFNWEDSENDLFSREQKKDEKDPDEEDEDEDEEEFEFAILCRIQDSPISADEIFFNGQIKPIYPLFNRDLLFNESHQNDQNNNNRSSSSTSSTKTTRLPLGKLMREEREASGSCSSSEADDLDHLQPGTYCVWTPKASSSVKESPRRACKKSNSTGSSKRWKFRDLLYRSNSDGKDTFVFLAPNKNNKSNDDQESSNNNNNKEIKAASGKVKVVEEHYVRSRALKDEDKKRSFLPYRQDLVGLFNNVNGVSRNLLPF